MNTHHWPKAKIRVVCKEPLKLLQYNPIRERLVGETKQEYKEYLQMRNQDDSKSE